MLGEEKVFRKRTDSKSNEEDGVWYNERQTETLRCPKVIDDDMQSFGVIDYNDSFRQGFLNWEQKWDSVGSYCCEPPVITLPQGSTLSEHNVSAMKVRVSLGEMPSAVELDPALRSGSMA